MTSVRQRWTPCWRDGSGRGRARSVRGRRLAPSRQADRPEDGDAEALRGRHRAATVTFGIGPAGTKTYLAMALAVAALQERQVSRIILTRPAVEAGERLGSCPATCLRRSIRTCARSTTRCTTCSRRTSSTRTWEGDRRGRRSAMRGGHSTTRSSSSTRRRTRAREMQMFLTRLGFGSKVVGSATAGRPPEGTGIRADPVRQHPRDDRRHRVHPVRPRGRRAAQARPAHRRGYKSHVEKPVPHGGGSPVVEVEVANRSGVAERARGPSGSCFGCSRRKESRTASSGSRSWTVRGEAPKLEHLGIDETPDVLSFPIDGLEELPAGVPRQFGDVVVCPEVVGEDWREPLVHGLLHLLGYDHGEEMQAREEAFARERRPQPLRPPELQLRVRGDHPRSAPSGTCGSTS